jgi:hypothetical protein
VTQFYIPVAGAGKPGQVLEYQPWVLGFAEVVFQYDRRSGAEHRETLRLLARAPAAGAPVDWAKALALPMEPASAHQAGARWAAVPETIDTGRKLKALEKAFAEHLVGARKLALFENRELEMVSRPGETRDAFLLRCRVEATRQRDEAVRLEEVKFAPKLEAARASTGKGREDRIARMEGDLRAKKDELTEKFRLRGDEAEEVQMKPRKADVRVTHFGLAWAPFWVAG